jgi:hypothetical protein
MSIVAPDITAALEHSLERQTKPGSHARRLPATPSAISLRPSIPSFPRLSMILSSSLSTMGAPTAPLQFSTDMRASIRESGSCMKDMGESLLP